MGVDLGARGRGTYILACVCVYLRAYNRLRNGNARTELGAVASAESGESPVQHILAIPAGEISRVAASANAPLFLQLRGGPRKNQSMGYARKDPARQSRRSLQQSGASAEGIYRRTHRGLSSVRERVRRVNNRGYERFMSRIKRPTRARIFTLPI